MTFDFINLKRKVIEHAIKHNIVSKEWESAMNNGWIIIDDEIFQRDVLYFHIDGVKKFLTFHKDRYNAD